MNDFEPLSESGEARKDRILQLAHAQARQLRTRRHAVRTAAVGIGLLVAASVVWYSQHVPKTTPTIVRNEENPPATQPAGRPDRPQAQDVVVVSVSRFQTEVGLSQRYAVKGRPRSWEILDDDQLLQQLAAIGRPAALARINGKEVVLFCKAE